MHKGATRCLQLRYGNLAGCVVDDPGPTVICEGMTVDGAEQEESLSDPGGSWSTSWGERW